MDKIRTNRQSRALHLMFQMIADELNGAGLDLRIFLKPEIEIPWNKDTVKEYIWRPVQEKQLMKESTTELTTKEIDQVFETLNRYLGEKCGLHIPFPSIESLIQEQQLKEMKV